MLYINTINQTSKGITFYTTARKAESLSTTTSSLLLSSTRKMQRPRGNWNISHFSGDVSPEPNTYVTEAPCCEEHLALPQFDARAFNLGKVDYTARKEEAIPLMTRLETGMRNLGRFLGMLVKPAFKLDLQLFAYPGVNYQNITNNRIDVCKCEIGDAQYNNVTINLGGIIHVSTSDFIENYVDYTWLGGIESCGVLRSWIQENGKHYAFSIEDGIINNEPSCQDCGCEDACDHRYYDGMSIEEFLEFCWTMYLIINDATTHIQSEEITVSDKCRIYFNRENVVIVHDDYEDIKVNSWDEWFTLIPRVITKTKAERSLDLQLFATTSPNGIVLKGDISSIQLAEFPTQSLQMETTTHDPNSIFATQPPTCFVEQIYYYIATGQITSDMTRNEVHAISANALAMFEECHAHWASVASLLMNGNYNWPMFGYRTFPSDSKWEKFIDESYKKGRLHYVINLMTARPPRSCYHFDKEVLYAYFDMVDTTLPVLPSADVYPRDERDAYRLASAWMHLDNSLPALHRVAAIFFTRYDEEIDTDAIEWMQRRGLLEHFYSIVKERGIESTYYWNNATFYMQAMCVDQDWLGAKRNAKFWCDLEHYCLSNSDKELHENIRYYKYTCFMLGRFSQKVGNTYIEANISKHDALELTERYSELFEYERGNYEGEMKVCLHHGLITEEELLQIKNLGFFSSLVGKSNWMDIVDALRVINERRWPEDVKGILREDIPVLLGDCNSPYKVAKAITVKGLRMAIELKNTSDSLGIDYMYRIRLGLIFENQWNLVRNKLAHRQANYHNAGHSFAAAIPMHAMWEKDLRQWYISHMDSDSDLKAQIGNAWLMEGFPRKGNTTIMKQWLDMNSAIEEYNNCQEEWPNMAWGHFPCVLPMTKTEKPGARVLNSNDPLCVILGDLSHCCQKRGGVGEACMLEGLRNPKSTFLVFEEMQKDYAKFVGQAWIWEGHDGNLVLDNIELADDKEPSHVTRQLIDWCALSPYKNIQLGTGYLNEDLRKICKPVDRNIDPWPVLHGYYGYSDANTNRVWLKKNGIVTINLWQ